MTSALIGRGWCGRLNSSAHAAERAVGLSWKRPSEHAGASRSEASVVQGTVSRALPLFCLRVPPVVCVPCVLCPFVPRV